MNIVTLDPWTKLAWICACVAIVGACKTTPADPTFIVVTCDPTDPDACPANEGFAEICSIPDGNICVNVCQGATALPGGCAVDSDCEGPDRCDNDEVGGSTCECVETPLVLDQPRNDDWDYFSDSSCDPAQEGCPNVVAENFLVPSTGASITEIVIWGGWWPTGTRTSDDWTVIIHADAAGLPGAAVYTQESFTATNIQNIGQIFGVGYYEVTLELAGDVDLPPGTHWIEIFHDSGPGDFWFWVTGDADPANGLTGFAEAPEAPGVSWSAHDVDSEPPLRRSLAIRISG